jgi:starch synthase
VHIVFAASECVPFAKTGGLADVVGALPQALAAEGHTVTVYLPRYRKIVEAQKGKPEPDVLIDSLTIPFDYYNRFVRIIDGGEESIGSGVVEYLFVDSPEMFDRDSLYGEGGVDYADSAERFALFSRAVIEATKQLGVPDIYHVHDWQSSMLTVYLRTTYYFDPQLQRTPSVLTIHNAGYQGTFAPATIQHLLLPWDLFTMDKLEQFDQMNFLKGGIVYADAVTTVSRKYAEEIQTPEFGHGLDPVLAKRKADLFGILNGVDYKEWSPANDAYIAAPFTPQSLAGKEACRRDLLDEFELSQVDEHTAVVGVVSRFATQKGFDLIAQAMEPLLQEDMVLVALGTGDPYYENLFRELQTRYPQKVRVKIGYDNALAHKIEAGADIFLMPSRYEPCGLNQIYSLKYGTVPVVTATGGLDDTIQEWDGEVGTGTGFKFSEHTPEALRAAMQRAIATYSDPSAWRRLMLNGMARDYSWSGPVKEYLALYKKVIDQREKFFAAQEEKTPLA